MYDVFSSARNAYAELNGRKDSGELAFDVCHDGGADYLMKDSPNRDGTDPTVLLSNGGEPGPKEKGPEPLGDEARVLCHSQAKGEQHVKGLLAEDLHVVHPPSQGICSLLPLRMLNDEVEVSLIERLSEPTLGDRVGNCWERGIWVKLFKLLDVLFGV